MTTNPGPPIVPGRPPVAPLTVEAALTPVPPDPRRPKNVMMPVVVVLAVLLAAAVAVAAWSVTRGAGGSPAATTSPSAQALNFAGTLTVNAFQPGWKVGDPCQGPATYSDLREGAQLVISDPAGKTIGVTTLSSGRVVREHESCEFTFGVGVPAGAGYYGLTIGDRKTRQVAEAELAGSLALTVGEQIG